MDADDSSSILSALAHWRIAVCVVAGAFLGWLLVVVLGWLSGLQGIALPFCGLFGGIVWESFAENRARPHAPKTTLAVATLSSAVGGCIWGGMSLESLIAGAVVLVVASAAWFWYATTVSRRFTVRQGAMILGAALVAYGVVGIAVRSAAQLRMHTDRHRRASPPVMAGDARRWASHEAAVPPWFTGER
jgi:hypothetical protein